MERRPARRARVLRIALAVAVASGISCGDSTGPSGAGNLPLAFSVDLAGGASAAFDAADAIRVTVAGNGAVVLDEVLPFSSAGQDVRLRVPVDPALDGVLLDVTVELRRGQDPLFRGSATVAAASGATDPVGITLEPVVAAIVPPPDPLVPAIGATLQLDAAAVFATGDTVPNVSIAYQLIGQGVIRLLPGGIAVGESEGIARVRAAAGGRSVEFDVEVRIIAVTVTVDPAQAIMGVGGTLRLVATAFDQTGSPLGRQPTWSSNNTAVATVTSAGVVSAVAAGTATITATVDAAQGTSRIEVSSIPPPAAPTGVTAAAAGTTVTLAWQDNATGETAYEVFRGPVGGTLAMVAMLPANARGYVDAGLPVDQVVDYVVSVCNQTVCSSADRVTTRTVPVAPSNLTVLQSSPSSLAFQLGWTDVSAAETGFTIEALDPQTGQFAVFGTVPAGTTQFDGTGSPSTTRTFRVVACNPAGCSPPSNTVTITFAAQPPTAITLPTITNTEMVGTTDADGQPHDWWFESYYDLTFDDPFSTVPVSTTTGGVRVEPLFDLLSNEKVYYRIVAMTAAGTSFGTAQMLTAPELEPMAPSSPAVCSLGPSCSVDPPTITFSAVSTGPLGFSDPFQFVVFDIESPSFIPVGSASVVRTDDPNDGVTAYTYSITVDASTLPVSFGPHEVVARGYPDSQSGNVVTAPIPFTVTGN